jgi:transcriptional regulator with XRE-family HTH domain
MPDLDITSVMRTLGKNMHRLRSTRGLSQQKAAERAGIYWRHWQKMEAGEGNPTLGTVTRIALALRSDLPTLFSPSR